MTGRAWGVILLILLLAAAGGGVWLRCEGTAPGIEAPESLLIGRDGASLVVRVSDSESGVREIAVRLRHHKGEQLLFERGQIELDPGTLPELSEAHDLASVTLSIEYLDHSQTLRSYLGSEDWGSLTRFYGSLTALVGSAAE